MASRPPEVKPDVTHDITAGAGLAASGNDPTPKSLWAEVVSEDTGSPPPPAAELRLASLPVSSLVLDPFLFSAISRKAEQDDPVPDGPEPDTPSPDVATLVAEYLPDKIESLVETAAALQEPVQAEGETTPSVAVQEETQAFFVDSETSELKNPPVELLPGVRIAVLSPVQGAALKAVARKATKTRMKSGEGEGEPEGEAEGEGEANPFDLLDLESDFVVFLDSFFEEYTPGQETTADLNAISVQTTGSFREILPAPNGIPDLAELLLIQKFLQDETLDFSLVGGPSHEDAADRWEYFETLYGPVADPGLAPVYRVGLAYSCLDDFMSMYLGAALLSIATEAELDGMNVLAALQTTAYAFCQSADVDGDDYSTLLEWQYYGTGQTFTAAYAAFEAAALNPAVYPASVDLHTVTRTCGQNILLFYPPVEKVADGTTLADYAVFGYDPAQFTHEPFFDHWVITGESALSPRYSGADQIEVLVEDDVTIEHTVLAPDLSTSITFPDAALEAAVRTAIGKPTGTLVLGDVYNPDFTELSATNAGIVSLDGLQHCRYLTSLNLSRNAVETLTPLSTLYRMTNLDLGCNLIEDVTSLSNLHDLKHLELGIMFLSYLFNPTLVNNNRPEDLAPLVSLRRLEYLGLTDTGLEEEALAPLAALDTLLALSIGKSPGVDLSPVASMDGLLLLIDHDSGLTDTDLNALATVSGLMSVFLYNNDLDDLDSLANCTNMQEVYVHNNPGFSEVPDTFPSMIAFSADGCSLTDIAPLGDLSVVQQLSLSDNDINDITPLLDITTFEEGASINILDNPLVHVDTCSTITALRARGVDVEENAGQCRRTLTYTAGPHGSIQGTSPQVVYLGTDGTPVQAVPATGHYFFQWSDARTDNPRTDTNVTENITVTAQFLPYQYPLVYLAGAHGVIDGPTPQIVDHGEDGLSVTAVPDHGYHFTDWDDGRIDNPRIDTANTEPLTVTAAFDINQYHLRYSAGPNGSIYGISDQVVNHGACAAEVEARPDVGYHFEQWSDGVSTALRTDCDNTQALSVIAGFDANSYILTFDGQGGTNPNPANKPVIYGETYGTLATTTRTGYIFSGWWTSVSGGKRILSTTPMTLLEDHAAYAHWTAREYAVYFDGQGGSVPNPPSKTVTYDQPYGPLPVASREGYDFAGWWTTSAGGVQITPETIMTNIQFRHTLYAHWILKTATLTYLAEAHGSIEGDAQQVVPYGECGLPITAVPDTGYHFVLWDDDSDDNPRMDCYNTEPLTVTASFTINQYTLTYAPGDYGTLSGYASQSVNHGGSGTAVEVFPNAGRTFVMWSDGVTSNPRTDTNVTANKSVTAIISAPAEYTLNYTAGPYGSITGGAIQYVSYEDDGDPVTAVPNTGCYFVKWSDERTDNPRTDVEVTANVNVTAVFAVTQFSLNYASGANGCIWGVTSQTVSQGGNGSIIVALADTGYHFAGWSDGWLHPGGYHYIRRDLNVVQNVNTAASFALNQYTLQYAAGTGGTISGETTQTVAHGGQGAVIQATENEGYHFVGWSDGWLNASGQNSPARQDVGVTGGKNVTAVFAINQYTVTYLAGTGIELYGPTQQIVNHGEDAEPVTAVAIPGYHFAGWSDDVTQDERVDTNVTQNISVMAASGPGNKSWPPPTLADCSAQGPVFYTVEEVPWFRYGVVYKYPDKTWYVPGEVVQVCYEPGTDERFLEWLVGVEGYDQEDISPDARFLDTEAMSGGEYCVSFYVTGNTLVFPVVDTDLSRTVFVHRPYPYMSYGSTEPEGVFEMTYGDELTVKALPSTNYAFTHWRGFPGGTRYEDPLTVEIRSNNEEFVPGFAYIGGGTPAPAGPEFTGSVYLHGGTGRVFTSDSAPGIVSHVAESSCRAFNFAAKVEVDKSCFPTYWSWMEQGVKKYVVAPSVETATVIRPLAADTSFTLHLVPRIRLNVLVEGEGTVPGFLPYTYNPEPFKHNNYNVTNTTPEADVDANHVTLSAAPHPGWEFSHWEILRGSVWEPVRNNDGLPLEGDLDIWMNWWPDQLQPGRHVEHGRETFNVKAVFLRPWIISLSGEGFSGSSIDSGMNTPFLQVLSPCYWANFFDEDVINIEGTGVLYDLLVWRLEDLEVKSIALVGHSHGGGSIAAFCFYLGQPYTFMDHNQPGIRPPTIRFTGYVDAIRESFPLDTAAEDRYPLGSLFHANVYQQISRGLNGTPTVDGIGGPIDPNLDINTLQRVSNQGHYDIDDCIVTHEIMKDRLDAIFYGKSRLSPDQIGDNLNISCQ